MNLRSCLLSLALLAMSIPVARAQTLEPESVPALAYPEGETAAVGIDVDVVVDESGQVAEASIRAKTPPDASKAFDERALETVRRARFKPVVVDGQPRRVSTSLHLGFDPPRAAPAEPVARPAEPEKKPAPEAPAQTVRVRGQRRPVAVGDLHLHVGALADVPRANAADLLKLAPGVLLVNHGGEGHAPAIQLRGFDAGEGQDMEMRLEGLPLNEIGNAHAHGYADANVIIPEVVDELRVIQGPFDPRQGDFAVAGTAEYHLGLHERGLIVKGTAGSFGTTRLLTLWGPKDEADGTFVGVDLRGSDGFGVSRASRSMAAIARFERETGPGTTVSVLGQGQATRFDSAGVVRLDDVAAGRMPCDSAPDAQFFCAYGAGQGGSASRTSLIARIVHKGAGATQEHQLFASTRRVRILENFTGFLADRPPEGVAPRGDLSERATDAVTTGGRGSLSWRARWNALPQLFEVGYLVRHDSGNALSRRLRDADGVPYKRDFDVSFDVTNVGLYADAAVRPVERLTLRGGVRFDAFADSLRDRLRPSVDRTGTREPLDLRDAFGLAASPRATLQFAFTPALEGSVSAGVGARSSDPAALSDGEFAPFSRLSAVEAGLAWQRGISTASHELALSVRGAAFGTYVERALLFDETAARNVLGPPSTRAGAMALVRAGLDGWLDAQASVTAAEAWQLAQGSSPWDVSGAQAMPYVPRVVGRFDASVRREVSMAGRDVRLGAALGGSYVSSRPLPLGRASDPFFVADASITARAGLLELGVVAQNLLDARYRLAEYSYASTFSGPEGPFSLRAARHFAAGAPRTLLATLTLHFGADARSSDETADHDHHDEPAPEATP